ncbi:MAG: ABC transporter permease, partial [Clostridium sp.]
MKKKWTYILFVPCLVLVLYFLIVPLINTIIPTFNVGGTFGLGNYIDFFKDEYMMKIFSRTLKISLISALICMVIGVPTAYYISRT